MIREIVTWDIIKCCIKTSIENSKYTFSLARWALSEISIHISYTSIIISWYIYIWSIRERYCFFLLGRWVEELFSEDQVILRDLIENKWIVIFKSVTKFIVIKIISLLSHSLQDEVLLCISYTWIYNFGCWHEDILIVIRVVTCPKVSYGTQITRLIKRLTKLKCLIRVELYLRLRVQHFYRVVYSRVCIFFYVWVSFT